MYNRNRFHCQIKTTLRTVRSTLSSNQESHRNYWNTRDICVTVLQFPLDVKTKSTLLAQKSSVVQRCRILAQCAGVVAVERGSRSSLPSGRREGRLRSVVPSGTVTGGI